ncbi:MAG: DNA methyltransferase [Candidatus Poribacteria bacterium]|nr:DNA methyltransferase [Candidatus Poribacteria bacterium]
MHENRTLVRGDNLEEMRKFPDECIDLIATDPPFNSRRNYFIPYRDEHGQEPDTLVRAFSDTWTWGDAAEDAYKELIVTVGGQIGDTIQGLRQFLNETPMMAYLVMMAIRLIEMHRILKSTGSFYLHCDPSASHYLKIISDAIFGASKLRNEIVWCYTGPGSPNMRQFNRKHDIIFWYAKGDKWTFNSDMIRILHKKPIGAGGTSTKWKKSEDEDLGEKYKAGKIPETWWTEFTPVGRIRTELLGYPTQKPRSLYERIIQASSNKGDFVLDPFCGCGTTLMAAESLGRQWIGIDLTYLAIGAVKTQAEKFFSTGTGSITVIGTPENENTALQLARTKPQDFEEWCVTNVLKFKSNAKKVADGGIDGTFRFPHDKTKGKMVYGKAVAQVKGGKYTLGHIREFRTAMQNEDANLGVFVVTKPPTRGMRTEASRAGIYRHPFSNTEVPRLQIYEIQDYFRDVLPRLPFGERTVL